MLPFYQLTLSMPCSVNASHTVARNKKGGNIVRSPDYTGWLQMAHIEFRNQFQSGIGKKFTGRIRADYIFIWNELSRGKDSSDISNREKVLSDFLQNKFFENDNQIDEQHHYRRFLPNCKDHVLARIYEIPDRRRDDLSLIFPDLLRTTA